MPIPLTAADLNTIISTELTAAYARLQQHIPQRAVVDFLIRHGHPNNLITSTIRHHYPNSRITCRQVAVARHRLRNDTPHLIPTSPAAHHHRHHTPPN